ncbi:MAG TPA: Nif3-like dinuclear metal center hexameric protein [Candidatus Gastranaerophilales bacterium]|nr:Nif3-like dinuclear metal center hexameric protein [Candidatus Gastranaerophilales bacterium]
MNILNKIIAKIEQFALLNLAKEWDNSGWQVYLGNKNIKKVMLALSPTLNVVESSIKEGCDLLITHHPLIFSGIKKISTANYSDLPLITAIRNNLQIYCAHTNLDITQGGIADVLAKMLDLKNISPLGTAEEVDFGRKGELEQAENLTVLIAKIKQTLNIDKLKLINPANLKKIKTIGLLPGSGGSFIREIKGIDLYITGDVKYHDALSAGEFAVIDAGHFETEKIILNILKNLLKECETEILIADENPPWELI